MSYRWYCSVCTYLHQFPNVKCAMCGTPKIINSSSGCNTSRNSDLTVGRRKRRNAVSVTTLPKHQRDQGQSQMNVDAEEMEIVSISSNDTSSIIDLTEMDNSLQCPAPKSLHRDKPHYTIGMVEKCTLSSDSTVAKSSSCTAPDANDFTMQNDETVKSLPRPSQSAYLQHLAEICATILHDERWKGVMSWEAGDDLSAMVALAKFEFDEGNHDDDFNGIHGCEKEEKSLQQFEEEARAMLLYCRMFVRKGPWFRLDDLLKYYSSRHSFFSSATQNTEQIHSNNDHEEERFHFHPTSTDQRKTHFSSIFQGDDPVKTLFRDVRYLLSIGLVRSFFDENECGVISGNNKSNGGVLTIEERNVLLRKIGCGSQKGNGTHASGTLTRNETTSRRPNRVILQMRSQKPLLFQKSIITPSQAHSSVTTNSDKSNSQRSILLPVRHHVETIFQNSIFSKSERITLTNELDNIGCLPPLCIRLTEKPLQCVRRCARLFLIASGGPGSMREGGWLSVQESPIQPCMSDDMANSIVHSSVLSTWSTVPYPGLQQRLKLKTFFFQSDYKKLRRQQERPQVNMPDTSNVTIFHGGVHQFHCWELACEVRAHISYLLEINQLLETTKRRERKRQSFDSGGAETSSFEHDHSVTNNYNCVEDSLNVLNSIGRETLVCRLLQDCNLQKETVDLIISKITSSLVESAAATSENKAIAILTSIVCIMVHVLRARISSLASNVASEYLSRPWLRHFQVEGIFAYCLWDVVEIFEKKGRYSVAVDILLLITGLSLPNCLRKKQIFTTTNDLDPARQAFVQLLLSRRSRGKAVERLVIDLLHILRKEAKELQESNSGPQKKSTALSVKEEHVSDQKSLFSHILASIGSTVPFSTIRTLARRLQCPLKDIMHKNPNMEVAALKLRLENEGALNIIGASPKEAVSEKINGWCPITDISVANSIRSEPGSRCTFVGWEDDTEITNSKLYRSLNVEELALEEYSNGRLPNRHPELIEGPSGGWIGWHDEGGHIRALFRILCCHEILGSKSAPSKSELLYLTPYQTSPLDLHVAAQSLPEGQSVGEGYFAQCFYYHRKRCVDEFLDKIGQMTQNDLCDIVYESIKRNVAENKSGNDAILTRDAGELRKLSLIAAGIGGKLLSAIFRCFCYDYRHYCAGLPDLILSRAMYEDSDTDLVDLVDWVGEGIDSGLRSTADSGSILTDRDDDFLGCSMSDGLVLSNPKNRKGNLSPAKSSDTQPTNSNDAIVIPDRLQLIHHNRKVKVQCMLVEVKSSNDRLDGRQQDWLNVIDRLGYARVCKFERSIKK